MAKTKKHFVKIKLSNGKVVEARENVAASMIRRGKAEPVEGKSSKPDDK